VLRARHRHAGVTGHAQVLLGKRLVLRRLLRGQHARAHRQRPPDERDADRDRDEQPEAAGEPALCAHW
jgi:hypothetical protein